MNNRLLAACVAAALALVINPAAHAQAKITLINLDEAGVGLNDATPAAPVGGNPGTTLGQQRLIAYQYAMDLWGALLSSDTEIRVTASFAPLTCEAGRIVLGQAGALSRVRASQIAPGGANDYDHPVALANALAKRDFTPNANHILTNFSSSLDLPACQALGGGGWYYGLTGNAPNKSNRANFLNVIMHEIGHGLGVSGNSRMLLGVIPLRSAKSAWDGLAYSNMHAKSYNDFAPSGDAEMARALVAVGQTVWTGARVTPTAGLLAESRMVLEISAPTPSRHDFVTVPFGGSNYAVLKDRQIQLVDDVAAAGATTTHNGCDGDGGQPLIANGAALAGKIALIDRGGCEFGRKALNAQKHGAVAVILANNTAGELSGIGGGMVGDQVTLPVITVTQAVGAELRAVANQVAGGLVEDPNRFYGLDANRRLRLYTPSPYAAGSSFSHVDTDMSPNALMEPAETKTLRGDVTVDVALDMFQDLGWPTNRNGTAKLAGCDTGVPIYRDTFIPGANLIAQSNLCKASAAGSRSKQLRCMNDHISALHRQTLITPLEMASARQCVAKL